MSRVQNDTSPIKFFMADTTDPTGRTGKGGLTNADITFKFSKGASPAFATGGGTSTVMTGASVGWYLYTPVLADVDTLGELGQEATAAGCFAWQDKVEIVEAGARAADLTAQRAAYLDNLNPATPLPVELVKVKGTDLGTHAGTALDPFGP